jgi:ATP-binding cassette, subfamily B, bacterial MsbA
MKMGRANPISIFFFMKRFRLIYGSLLFVTIGYAAFASVSIAAFFPLLSSVTGQDGGAAHPIFKYLGGLIGGLPFGDPLTNACVLLVCMLVMKELLAFGRQVLIGYGVGMVVCDTRERVFQMYGQADYQFFLDKKHGVLLYNLLTATASLSKCLQHVPDLITALFMTLSMGALMVTISWRVTLFLAVVGLLFNVVTQWLGRKVSYHIGTDRIKAGANNEAIAHEFIDGIKHIKILGATPVWIQKFSASVRTTKQLVIDDCIWLAVPERVMQLLPAVILVGVTIVLKQHYGGTSSLLLKNLALIGVYAFALQQLVPFLTSFGKLSMQLMGTLPDVEVLYNLLARDRQSIRGGSQMVDRLQQEFRFDQVDFGYPGKPHVLRSVSFHIVQGQTTAIVGPTGSGKSTVVHLLTRLFDVEQGRILLDGTDIRELQIGSLRQLMAVVSQEMFMFHGSIRDNITFGMPNVSQQDLEHVTQLAHAHDFIMECPEGYDTVIGNKGLKLSGGQRQRIAIARALLRDPQMLILDEATSSLDYHSEQLVQQAINDASNNRTVVVIAHRLSTVINADKIIVLRDGEVAAEGTHAELMRQQGVYRSLYESQESMMRGLQPEEVA